MPIGILAGIAGSFLWAAGSSSFAMAVRRLGVFNLNLLRLNMALVYLALLLWILTGSPVPLHATGAEWFWLGMSAVVGLVVGDLFYFGALKEIGPRLTMVLFTFAPPVAAAGEWLAWDHPLGPVPIAGILLTMVGVAVVVLEKPPAKRPDGGYGFSMSRRGLILGILAAVFQGAGLVLSKAGLQNLDSVSGTFMRMAVAALCFGMLFPFIGKGWKAALTTYRQQPAGVGFAMLGAFFGPFLWVTMSLVAVKYTHAGIAMTLLSTTPITILPYSVLVFKERLTLRAVAGATVAVAGVAMLALG